MSPRPRRTLAALPLLLVACGEGAFGPITELPRELTVAETALVDADNRFAGKLFRQVAAADPRENVFLSPLSVGMALGMTYNGAAGTTRDEMAEAMELQGLSIDEVNQGYRDLIDLLTELDPAVAMDLANSIWYRIGFPVRPAFVDATQTFFDAQVEAVDFSDPGTPGVINGWVSDNTKGKIESIVPEVIPGNVVMYLINAVYFKGSWTTEFDPDDTRPGTFTRGDGSTVEVDMMHHHDPVAVRAGRVGDVAVLELPYGGDAYGMTIVLPDEGVSLESVIDGWDASTWETWTTTLAEDSIPVSMPKFTLEYEVVLNEALQALGMQVPFTGEADFSNLVEGGGVWIDEVRHKTFVNVNEEGTEAAAVTSVVLVESAGPTPFVVDRPFVFAIRERFTGTIVFLGALFDPAVE